jgi:hypothetical protein
MYYTPVPYRYEPPQENHPRPSRFPIQSQIIVLQFIGFALLAGTFATPFAVVYRETQLVKAFFLFQIDLGLFILVTGLAGAIFSLYGCPRLTLGAIIMTVGATFFLLFTYASYVPMTDLIPYESTNQVQPYVNYDGFGYSSKKIEYKNIVEIKKITVTISRSPIWVITLILCHFVFAWSAFLKRQLDRESPT